MRGPEIISEISSTIPKVNAAEKPTTDQMNGMIRIATGQFLYDRSNKPKVKIVVGHGRPKVGEEG